VEAGNGGGYGALLAHPWRTSGETEKGKEGNGDRRGRFKGDDDDSGFASAFANLTTHTAARPSARSAVKDMAVSRASTLLLGTVANWQHVFLPLYLLIPYINLMISINKSCSSLSDLQLCLRVQP
jgi:hypothetical protein